MTDRNLLRRNWFGTAAGVLALPFASGVPLANAWAGEVLPVEPDDSIINPIDKQLLPIRILFNENPNGCSKLALEAVRQSLSKGHFYPFEPSAKLTNKLRAKHGLPALPESRGPTLRPQTDALDHTLVLSNGSSELLLAAALAFSVDGGNVVEPALTYQTVGNTAKNRPGPKMERRQIALRKDGGIDANEMLSACDSQTRMMVITNPNNPTGGALQQEDLQKLLTKAPRNTLVIVDEAYIDFLDDHEARSAIPFALRFENVLVTRTFSKIHGLAGLRLGYGIGHKSIFTRMQLFQVGSLSLNLCGVVAANAALDDIAFQNASRASAADSRKRISSHLNAMGFRVAKCDAACIWAEWDRDASMLIARLAERGVLISSGMRWNAPNCVRISVATEWQTTRLLDELTAVVKQV